MRLGSVDDRHRLADQFLFGVTEGFTCCRIDVQNDAPWRNHVAGFRLGLKEFPESAFALQKGQCGELAFSDNGGEGKDWSTNHDPAYLHGGDTVDEGGTQEGPLASVCAPT